MKYLKKLLSLIRSLNWTKDDLKRFIFCACLIVFSAVIFYIVCPKWEYTFTKESAITMTMDIPYQHTFSIYQHYLSRYNKITGKNQDWNKETKKWIPSRRMETKRVDIINGLADKIQKEFDK